MRYPTRRLGAAVVLGCALLYVAARAQSPAGSEWTTWGFDQARSGWNRLESTLSKDNVSRLTLKWTAQLETPPNDVVLSTLTAPLVVNVAARQGARTLVIVAGSDDAVYAIDADTGATAWRRRFPNSLTPKKAATTACPNTENATPVVDKAAGIVYLTTTDGTLRGLDLVDGKDRMPASAYVPSFVRNWSLNLIDHTVYTPLGRGCNDATAQVAAIDLNDPNRHVAVFFTGAARIAGAWGRGGVARGPKGIYLQTADGLYDPAAGKFGNTVMALNLNDLRLVDSFTPANWEYLNAKDLDLSSAAPLIVPFGQKTLVASAGKESVVYLLDADNLGGPDHHTPLYQSPHWGNDEMKLFGKGVWGAMATWESPSGTRWILMPMWGPPAANTPAFRFTYGDANEGSVMAFQVAMQGNTPALIPVWRSRNMHVPDSPVVANGVVYALETGENTALDAGSPKLRSTPVTNATLYALDAETGKVLYSSGRLIQGWTHFSQPVVAGGTVYVSTWDAKVYAFGLRP